MRHHPASDFDSVRFALFVLVQLVYTILPRYELMLPGKASAFQDLGGLRNDVSFGLEFAIRSRGSWALLRILPTVFDLSSHSTIPHITAFVIDIAF